MNDRLRFARYPGSSAMIIFAPLFIGLRDGIFTDAGIDLEVHEPAGHPWTAVAAGEADLGVSYVDYWFRPELRGRFVLIGVHEAFAPGTGLTTLLARSSLVEDARLQRPSDIAGKRVALLPNRGDDYMVFRCLLDQAGLTFDDVIRVEVPHRGPERGAALANGAVDVVIGRRPTDIQAEVRQGLVTRWLVGDEAAPDLQARFLVASSQVLATNRDAVTRFLAAYHEATRRFWNTWPDPAEVRELTGDAVDVLTATKPPGFPLDVAIDLTRLEAEIDALIEGSLVPDHATRDGLVDLEPLTQARQMATR